MLEMHIVNVDDGKVHKGKRKLIGRISREFHQLFNVTIQVVCEDISCVVPILRQLAHRSQFLFCSLNPDGNKADVENTLPHWRVVTGTLFPSFAQLVFSYAAGSSVPHAQEDGTPQYAVLYMWSLRWILLHDLIQHFRSEVMHLSVAHCQQRNRSDQCLVLSLHEKVPAAPADVRRSAGCEVPVNARTIQPGELAAS